MYSIKSLKTFVNRTPGFNVKLLRDGKHVADVTNGGDGGCFRFYWKDRAEEAALLAHVKTLPPVEFGGDMLDMDADMFVEGLVEDLELEREVKRLCKHPSIIGGGALLQFKKSPLNDALRKHVAATYPNVVFLNDLTLADAVKALKQLAPR